MHSTKFSYLYRDAGNYKKCATVVFSNPDGLSSELITKTLRDAFLQDGLFIATQIRVPDVFLYVQGDASSDDHCFHEFDAVEICAEAANDKHSRSISQFIAEVRTEGKRGWVAFNPHEGPVQRVSN